MRDDPRKNLKWLEQQLLEEDQPWQTASESEGFSDLMEQVDKLIAEPPPAEAPLGNFSRRSKGARAERAHISQQFDKSAAVLTKTKRQLRREAKQRKQAEKKSKVNHNLKDLVILAVVEILGILCILGWWLQ